MQEKPYSEFDSPKHLRLKSILSQFTNQPITIHYFKIIPPSFNLKEDNLTMDWFSHLISSTS